MYTTSSEERYSWVIAVACCFINCLLYGVSRLSGLLLVATVDTFHVSRAKAALPYIISTSVRNLSGIFVGYLGRKFGLRAVISAGCLLSSLGAALCFIYTDIVWITICWGGLFGIGCGLGTCLLPLAINQHFNQNRGTASGISYSGSYIGSFVFPPVVVFLLERYGLPGTFLVMSGTMLNGLAAAMFFRPVPPCDAANKYNGPKVVKERLSSVCQSSAGNDNRFKCLLHKLLEHIKFSKHTLKTKESTAECAKPSIYIIAFDKEKQKCQKPSQERAAATAHAHHSEKETTKELRHPAENTQNCFSNHDLRHPSQCVLLENESGIDFGSNLTTRFRRYILNNFFRKDRVAEQDIPSQDSIKLTFYKHFDCILCVSCGNVQNQLNFQQGIPNSNRYFIRFERVCSMRDSQDPEQETTNCKYIASLLEEKDAFEFDQLSISSNCLDAYSNIPITKGQNFATSQRRRHFTANSIDRTSNCYGCDMSNLPQCNSLNLPSGKTFDIDICNKSKSYLNEKELPDKSKYIQSPLLRSTGRYMFGWLRQFYDPMFCVITVTMSLHTFVLVCMVTIIEDFAKDINVPDCQAHLVIMVLSSADLVGSLSLGFVTDLGWMSRNYFVALCFSGAGITSIAISFSNTLTTLLVLIAFYGIFETGVIITFPLLIAQFIKPKKQPVALASSNVLSCPTVLLVPLLIGYFRDQIGCYSGVFYVLGATSIGSCFIWILAPYLIGKCTNRRSSKV